MVLGEFASQRQIGKVELGQPGGNGMEQCFAGAEVERSGAARDAGLLVDFGVADAVNSVGAQQLNRGVSELLASLGRIVFPACSNAPSLSNGC